MNSRLLGELVDDLDCEAGVDMCGHFFDLSIADLNLDSNLDLLMTINSGVYGELVVYDIPEDFRFVCFVFRCLAMFSSSELNLIFSALEITG